jgi:hypothetical protein
MHCTSGCPLRALWRRLPAEPGPPTQMWRPRSPDGRDPHGSQAGSASLVSVTSSGPSRHLTSARNGSGSQSEGGRPSGETPRCGCTTATKPAPAGVRFGAEHPGPAGLARSPVIFHSSPRRLWAGVWQIQLDPAAGAVWVCWSADEERELVPDRRAPISDFHGSVCDPRRRRGRCWQHQRAAYAGAGW